MSRVRKPSAKLLEIVRGAHTPAMPPPPNSNSKGKRKSASSGASSQPQPPTGQTAGKKTQTPTQATFEGPGGDSHRLYCVCLGTDDQTPMIQCEGCENWFHFRCIELSSKEARRIKSYFCEICTEVGAGVTTKTTAGVAKTSKAPRAEFRQERAPSSGGEGEGMRSDGGNYQGRLSEKDESTDSENSEGGQRSSHNRKVSISSQNARKRKAKQPEGLDSEESEDNDYMGEGDVRVEPRQKRVPKPKRQVSGNARGSYYGSNASVSAEADRMRQTCTTSLITSLQPIFATTFNPDEAVTLADKTQQFATTMESEMFEQFAEQDPRGGPRQVKQKYLTKLRQLLFNLKSNETFRNRVASGQLDPSELVNVSPEDLMSAEQRAMAQNVRAKSLKESVKTATEAPKLKRTHKGEEVVDEFMTLDTTAYAKVEVEENKGDIVASPLKSPVLPEITNATEDVKPVEIPDSRHLRTNSATFKNASADSYIVKAEDIGFSGEDGANMSAQEINSPKETPKSEAEAAKQPPSPPKSNFDFDSVWGGFKSPTTPQLDAGLETEPVEAKIEDTFDPFTASKKYIAKASDDMDLDDILNDEQKPIRSTTPTDSPILAPPKQNIGELVRSLPAVWSGDVLMPEEGGFPSIAVQVAGRNLGTALQFWQMILPNTINMTGRIPASSASEYLLKCTLAQSRELVVVALQPDLSGPNPINPLKPAPERVVAKMEHLVDYFTGRERNGVCPPVGNQKQIVKDVYIVPLRPSDPVPEYIEHLDHSLGEINERDANMLLAVLVLQKSAIPNVAVPVQNPAPFPTASSAPVYSNYAPAFSPPVDNGMQSAINSEALQSLLSQPQFLASFMASQQQQQTAPQPFVDHNMLQSLASNPALVQSLLQNPGNSAEGMSPPRHNRQRSRSPPNRRNHQQERRPDRRGDFNQPQRDSGWGSRGRR